MDLKNHKYELNESMGEDELIRSLKMISESLQSTAQEEETQDYIPLALQLSEDFYLSYPSKDVQLLVACCIADIMRIYAPEAPYKDQDQIKTIFMFLVRQLEGIANPRHKSFSRYFYLMEILAYTKSFTLCFEIEENQDVFVALFKLIFKIMNVHEPSQKVKSFMLDIMCPLITEADNVGYELLDVIFKQIIEPEKSQNSKAYDLCCQLITKTTEALSLYIKNFLCSELVSFENSRSYETTSSISKIFDVMYELYIIAPSCVKLVMPTLESKLQAKEESNRLKALDMLIKLLNDEFVEEFPQLWQQFKQRYADISPAIRKKCVAGSKNFLTSETKFRDEIIQQLCARKRDSDESVRLQVVAVVVDATKKDWRMILTTQSLFDILKERILDTKYAIRKEALQGFSLIHKSYVTEYFQQNQNTTIPDDIKEPIAIVKNKILHGYYMKTVDDKILIERIFVTCLVPYNMDTKTRMKVLYQLLLDLDEHANRAFIELQRQQTKLRMLVYDWLKIHKLPEPNKVDIATRGYAIAANLPEQNKAKEYILKFSSHMTKDNEIMHCLEAILSRDISCSKCTEKIQSLLKKCGSASANNFYFSTVKNLLNRIASVTVDREAIEAFVEIVETKQKGCEILPLTTLSQVFPAHFQNDLILEDLVDLLKRYTNEPGYKENLLKTFTHLIAYKSFNFPQIIDDLMVICKNLALEGTPKQCKQALLFICKNSNTEILTEIINSLEASIIITNPSCRTAITALGVISENFGEKYQKEISKIIGRNIVRGLLLNAEYETQNSEVESWILKDDLPEPIQCVMAACKATVKWLYGLKSNDLSSAQKTMKIYDALIVTNGNIQEKNKINKYESAWIKLTAAKAILKIGEHKIFRKSISPQHYLNLSKIMLDENVELREEFVKRLHKGLNRGISNENALPLEFLSLYVFGGLEKEQQLLDLMRKNFNAKMTKANDRDKDNANSLCMNLINLPLYGIALLTHSSILNDSNDILELRKIEKCLKFIIDPLIDNLESTSNIDCIKKLIRRVKLSKNSLEPDNENINVKMWTISEIADKIMKYSSVSCHNSETVIFDNVELPDKYFQKQPSDFSNDKTYLSQEFLNNIFHSNNSSNLSRKRCNSDSNSATSGNDDDDDENDYNDRSSSPNSSKPNGNLVKKSKLT